MDLKIKDALTWGRFVSIFGFITSIFTMMSCIGIPVGVIMLISFMKLNNATDELKRISLNLENATKENYEEVVSIYGKFLKMMGIASIVSIAMSIIGVILYILLFVVIFSRGMGSYMNY